jgi:hypothetical protein
MSKKLKIGGLTVESIKKKSAPESAIKKSFIIKFVRDIKKKVHTFTSDTSINKYIKNLELDINENKLTDNPSDILVISLNENKRDFGINSNSYTLYNGILKKIILQTPSVVILCTQKGKKDGNKHYQHVISKLMLKLGYEYTRDDHNKVDSLRNTYTSGITNSLRMRIYYRKNSNFEIQETKSSDRIKRTLYNKLTIKNIETNKETKFIFLNIDYNSSRENTDSLIQIIKDYKLIEEWNNGFNIFICGYTVDLLRNNNSKFKSEYNRMITATYLKSESESVLKKLSKNTDEYKYFMNYYSNKIKAISLIKPFYEQLIKSIKRNKSIFLKYFEKFNKKNIESMKNGILFVLNNLKNNNLIDNNNILIHRANNLNNLVPLSKNSIENYASTISIKIQ